jgi:nucleoside-diphosphate-sugar epimerase
MIYLTGVAGMIGSNTARALLEDEFEVIGIDNLWRGTRDNIADLLPHPRFAFRHADLISDRDWYRDMGSGDIVIHMADIVAGVGYVFANEWSVFQKNLLINSSIARAVTECAPARLIYLGTACSYPQEMQRSVTASQLSEDDKFPADPESGYGWSKLAGEIEFRLATKDVDTRFTVLDLHNVYGWPCTYRDSTAQVIPSLIFRAHTATDGVLTVWGDGSQGRAFVHVSDVVSAVRLALGYSGEQPSFMIGPNHCTTIADLARIIQTHPRIDIADIAFDVSKPTGDIGRFADPALAQSEMGWTLRVDLETGVHDLIDRIIDDSR